MRNSSTLIRALTVMALLANAPVARAVIIDGGWYLSFSAPSAGVTGNCAGSFAESGMSFPLAVSTPTPLACQASAPGFGTVSFNATLSGYTNSYTLDLMGSATSLCASLSITASVDPPGPTTRKTSFAGSFSCDTGLGTITGSVGGTLACGDGFIDPSVGEQCDDDNQTDGDCCSSTCQIEGNNSPCTDDANECTTDYCWNGACLHDIYGPSGLPCSSDENACTMDLCSVGSCTHEPFPTIGYPPCDDGDVCTGNDACTGGYCIGGGPPTTCDDAVAGKAVIQIRPNVVPSKRKLKWKWTSAGPFDVASLGSPATTDDVVLCAFDQNGDQLRATVEAGGTCAGGKPCWTVGEGKVKYRDSAGISDGITKLDAKSGEAGRGKLQAQGKGYFLTLPSLPLAPPVTVHAVREDGSACWQATFSTPIKNDSVQFKAKSD